MHQRLVNTTDTIVRRFVANVRLKMFVVLLFTLVIAALAMTTAVQTSYLEGKLVLSGNEARCTTATINGCGTMPDGYSCYVCATKNVETVVSNLDVIPAVIFIIAFALSTWMLVYCMCCNCCVKCTGLATNEPNL